MLLDSPPEIELNGSIVGQQKIPWSRSASW
jgi:hypothetical protein